MKNHRIVLFAVLMLAAPLTSRQAFAQSPAESPPQTAAQTQTGSYSREQLAQMLAPIALYPDPLLSQILMASTYPIEIVEADRWLKRQPKHPSAVLDAALLKKKWDPSVKSLCHYPALLAAMDKNLSRTTLLGNAFLAQQADVMSTIQDFRRKAQKMDALKDYPQQRVEEKDSALVILPAEPAVVYVPYYNPLVVYGPWWYPAYPPYVWFPGSYNSVVLAFSPGYIVGPGVVGWSYFNWPGQYIGVNYALAAPFIGVGFVAPGVVAGGVWLHNPAHRLGAAYVNAAVAARFNQAATAGSAPGAARGLSSDSRTGATAVRPGVAAGAAKGGNFVASPSPSAGHGSQGNVFNPGASQPGAPGRALTGGSAKGHGGGFAGPGEEHGFGGPAEEHGFGGGPAEGHGGGFGGERHR